MQTDAFVNAVTLEYPYSQIKKATNNFSESNKLGQGAHGSVYKGKIYDGTTVAVKMLQNPKHSGFKEEVRVLSKFRHPCLVILMGYSKGLTSERILLYEYMAGGDLYTRLTNRSSDTILQWNERISILFDSSLGISHLINSNPRVYHRDIKSMNILLDGNGKAKVADFGLALLANSNSQTSVTSAVGTLGYADPAYIETGVVSESTEVYSFGMLILESMTGSAPAIQSPSGTISYPFKRKNRDELLKDMVQWECGFSEHQRAAKRVLDCGIVAVQKNADGRPTFRQIVEEFSTINSYASKILIGEKSAEELEKKELMVFRKNAEQFTKEQEILFNEQNTLLKSREEIINKLTNEKKNACTRIDILTIEKIKFLAEISKLNQRINTSETLEFKRSAMISKGLDADQFPVKTISLVEKNPILLCYKCRSTLTNTEQISYKSNERISVKVEGVIPVAVRSDMCSDHDNRTRIQSRISTEIPVKLDQPSDFIETDGLIVNSPLNKKNWLHDMADEFMSRTAMH